MRKIENKSRMIERTLIRLIFLFILLSVVAIPVSFWTHYEKKVYQETVPLTKEDVEADLMDSIGGEEKKVPYGVSGYPSTGISTKITSIEDLIANKYEAISLEIDTKNLKRTGLYEQMQHYGGSGTSSNFSWKSNASKGSVSHSKFGAPLHTKQPMVVLWNRTKAIYAQYYVLTLEDGSKVLLLLNDTALPITHSGTIKLPLALWCHLFLERGMSEEAFAEEHGVEPMKDKDIYFLDAATSWGKFYAGVKKAHSKQSKQAAVLVITGIVGAIVCTILLFIVVSHDKSLEETPKNDRKG